ncbi:MAG: amino acid adenylation domain-containing protein [Clostridia bacterium]|nr:amino acid adenylation domain-containing protein [Clostridia bacterium]
MKFKLTSSQMNFYNKNFNLDSQIWNQGVMEIFPKVYSYDEINTAYNKLVENHDSLRVKLVETETGVVADVREHEFINYRFWQVETEEELMEKAQDFLNEPTDRYGLLVNCAVFQTPTTSGIMINAHHIVVDGYSVIVMAEHMNELLKDINFTPVIQEYSDYIEAEEKHKQSRRFDKAKDFWLKEFSNKPDFNIFTAKGNTFDFYSEEVNSVISKDLFYKVDKFCQENEISVTSFFNTIYGIYFSKMYETSSFTMGVPVLNRTTQAEFNTIGLYMHVLPMVCNVDENASFLYNAKQFEDSQMNLLRHQKFTQTDIKETLKSIDFEENNLFSVAADYQSFTTKDEYEVLIKYANYLATPLEIHLQSFNETLHKFKIRYRTSYFSKEEVEIMLKSIIALAENAVENPDKTVCELEMISTEEKQKILYDFNNTTVEYSKDKGVYELFENQVVKTPDKTAVIFKDIKLTYSQLNDKIKECADRLNSLGLKADDVVAVHLERSYELIAFQLAILKIGAIFLPVDKRYPVDRIQQMCINCDVKLLITDELEKSSVNANVILLNDFNSVSSTKAAETVTNLGDCYIIYTSGSTGMPKGCLLTGKGLLNFCMNNNTLETLNYIEQPIFACVNSASFDYFIAETLLPLTNGFTTVVLDDNESTMQDRFLDVVTKNNINVIMTTPTRLKIYFNDKHNCSALKNMACICTSGEPLTPELLEQMYTKSPDAMVYNPIGPSECSVWDMGGRLEKSDGLDVHIGKPIANAQIYIVDRYLNPTPIGVTGEICIAGDGVGSGYINNPELTAERFIENPFGEGKLYKTGDLAYWRPDGNICYVGRNDFQVKVRGLRIELGEIESVLEAIDEVEHAVAVVRNDDQNRQLICAFYTGTEIDTNELRTILSSTLPRYMVPHIFTYLETLPMTVSGKLDRKALPEIALTNISAEVEYVAPETREENVLIEAIKEVLNTEKVSVIDSFFDMGGDSLKSIELTNKIEEKGYTVNVKNIFEATDIQSLAKKLQEKTEKEEKVIYDSVIPATSAQMNVYTAQKIDGNSTLYNISYIFKTKELDVERLEKAINKLIEKHESLRTHFENRNGQVVQVINKEATIQVRKLESENAKDFIKPFDLTKAPLLRVGYIENTVMIDMHHIIADGSSSAIFMRELNELYMGRELKPTVQYGEFAVTDTYTDENEKYWLNVFNEEIETLELPTDYQRPEIQSFKGTNIYTRIDNELNEKIQGKCKQLGITPYAYYMACYNILLSKFSGNEDICVGMPVSGRSSKYLNTMGMFVNTIALRNYPVGTKIFKEFANEVKESSISAIANQQYPFSELVNKLNIHTRNGNPLYDVMFAYQSEEMTEITFGDKKAEDIPTPVTTSKCDLSFYVFPRENEIVLMTEYCTYLFKKETINKFIEAYNSILAQCLDENILIKDISVLTEEEKNKVFKDFNDTAYTYDIPNNSTIYSLFEEQAEKNKDKVCIIANDEEITFKEFKKYAERIDSKVRKYTKEEKSVIAVICERSFEMYGAVYGIIRGGNAYLPIDPNYPQDRIDYILENSNAKAVIAQDKFCHLAGDVPCIDATEVLKNRETIETKEILAKPEDTAYVIYTSGSTGNPKGAKISHKSAVNRILWMHDFYPLTENDVILQKTPYTFDVSVWELFWWGMTGRTLCASKPDEHFLPAKILEETEKNKVTHLHFVPSVFDLFLTYLENNPEEQQKFNTVKYVFLSGEALTANHINRFYKMYDYNKVQLHNLYGPTECAVDVSYYPCVPTDTDPVPIGKPIGNTQLYIVDRYMNPTPIGVVGELCIGGVNVGQGYLNNETLTNEKFIDNPFREGKIYKTGDLAYWREDGEIIFCGRMDHQIKLNGQRIELGEIEKVIGEVDNVESVVVMIMQNNGKDVLVAYCCGNNVDKKYLKAYCDNKLPRYMVPSAFVTLDKMPLNASGKLDRKQLKSIEVVFEDDFVKEMPINDTEKMLCSVFERTLKIENVGKNESFFSLGGTSIDMIAVLSEGEMKNITPAQFIANPTPKKLAEILTEGNISLSEGIEVLRDVPGAEKVLVVVPYAGGDATAYAKFVESMANKSNDMAIYYVKYLRSYDECKNIAETLAQIGKDKKLYIYSHCAGAAVAMQIINILEEMNIAICRYVAGGYIPLQKPLKKNVWDIVPDKYIKKRLVSAGAPLERFSDSQNESVIDNFRKDTDFMTWYHYSKPNKIKVQTDVIISKTDSFTKNYKNAEKLWKLNADNFNNVHFIETNSHYFQSDNSDILVDVLVKIFEQ